MARALITGITGQDGRHLAHLLVGKGYEVFGMIRGQANPKAQVVQDETPELELLSGDLQDLSSLIAVVEQVQPDEVYNLAAISFIPLSFRQPELTADTTGTGVLRMLEAIRVVGGSHNNRPCPSRPVQARPKQLDSCGFRRPRTTLDPLRATSQADSAGSVPVTRSKQCLPRSRQRLWRRRPGVSAGLCR
jgi:hypothetical protein